MNPSLRSAARRNATAVLGSLAAVLVAAAPAVAAARWRWPVSGEVVGAYRYSARAPFSAGQRRGIDIAAARGTTVRAACAGLVTHAGATPAWSLGVTVRCGALAATHLGLGRLAVRRGARVAAGSVLGAAGPGGRVRLGARVAARRFAYVDPLGLLRVPRPPGGPALPGLGRAPRPGPPPTAPRLPAARPLAAPALAPQRSPRVPALAWAGAALLAAATGAGGLVRARRARRGTGDSLHVAWAPSTSPPRSTTSTRLRTWATRTRRSPPT